MEKDKIKMFAAYTAIIYIGGISVVFLFCLIFNIGGISSYIQRIMMILRPFAFGAILAYILKSTCSRIEKIIDISMKKTLFKDENVRRKIIIMLSVTATYFTWVIGIAVLSMILMPQLIESFGRLTEMLYHEAPRAILDIQQHLTSFVEDNVLLKTYFGQSVSGFSVKFGEVTGEDILAIMSSIGSEILGFALNLAAIIKDAIIGLIISVLFLIYRRRLAEKVKKLINVILPSRLANFLVCEARYADEIFGGFMTGKIIDSALIGVIYFIFMSVFKIPYASLVSVICGITNIIPIFGPFIGAIPSSIIILTASPAKIPIFLAFVIAVQVIDGNIIEPHIVGDKINMSALGVLFAVVLFGGLFGFFGLIFGVPIFAVICDIIKRGISLFSRYSHDASKQTPL